MCSSDLAMAILATMVGAVTLSRVVNDPDLAQALLNAAAEQVRDVASLESASPRSTERSDAQHD